MLFASKSRFIFMVISLLFLIAPVASAATLADQVPTLFKAVFGRTPTATEQTYWQTRSKTDKTTVAALQGAMGYQKAKGTTVGAAVTATGTTKTSAPATNKDQLIKDVLPLFIKVYGNNPSEAEKAWWRKRITCNELKDDNGIIASMQFHKDKKARMGGLVCGEKPTSSGSSSSGSSAIIRRTIAGISNNVMGDQVRIGIYKTNGKAITVSADGKFQVREGESKILKTLNADQDVAVSWSGGKYHIRGSGLNYDTTQQVRFLPLNSAIMQIKSYSDPSVTYPGKNYNRFRGTIEIRKDTASSDLWAINELRAEYYLRGLGETSGEGPEEYIKALGIAARTYVFYHKVITGGRNQTADFDIGNTPLDQIYRGYEYELITPRMASIFAETKGIIVADGEGDKPVASVYFSDSDGRTRSAQEVWHSSHYSYLQSVPDPFHNASACSGHCVGMSAQGAYGFAKKENWSFQKILNYYYQGIKLVKAY